MELPESRPKHLKNSLITRFICEEVKHATYAGAPLIPKHAITSLESLSLTYADLG